MKIINYIKKMDKVMVIAWILAIISAFFIHPDREYIEYIDFRSLGILWGLMVIIQGLKENSVFERIAGVLLSKVKSGGQLAVVLVFMCFFGSMFITNDVALITFVPFAIMILSRCKREDMMIIVIVLQTIAANLGSMLTPIGNPQNLYMYGITGMGLQEFIVTMLPYSLVSALLLAISILLIRNRSKELTTTGKSIIASRIGSKTQILVYSVLFIVALMTVVRAVPWYVFVIVVLVTVFFMDLRILFRADYILLLTFVGFFIFTGNMGRIEAVRLFFELLIEGREFLIAICASQIISNVPATLMLSGFTQNYKELLIGVNVGGLGTLIASMASLISYKAYSKEYKENGGKYIKTFTVFNLGFLLILIILWWITHKYF